MSSRYSRWIFGILVIFLFLEILVGFPIPLESENHENPAPMKDFTQVQGGEQKMEGVHLVESRLGSRDWELFAEAAEGNEGAGSWHLKNVRVLFYAEDKLDYTVTGETGLIDTRTKDMNISGNVKTLSANGYRFETKTLDYVSANRTLKSPSKVKMLGPPDTDGEAITLVGDRMEASLIDNLMKVFEHVQAQKNLKAGKSFQIRSEAAEFSSKFKSARFFNQVTVQVDSMTMQGAEAQFQYDSQVDFVSSLLVRGGVKMIDADKYATSDSVKFDPVRNQFLLLGRPRVVQNNDEITGDKITFIDGGKKVKVENINGRLEKE